MDCQILYSALICWLCIQFSTGEVERALRLRGGRTALEGQLEVYLDGGWGVIHDEDWTLDDATVACRQMGFAGAADALQTGYAGVWPPSARVVLDSVACTGKEISLLACSYGNVSRLLGNGEMIASVVCAVEGSIQLVGGCCIGEGVLKTWVRGAWLPVCAEGWGREESRVACRQLGFEQGAMFQVISHGNVTYAPNSYNCSGSEYTTLSCLQTPTQTAQCSSMRAISLQCTNLNSLRQLCSAGTTPPPNCQPVAPQTVVVAGASCSSLTLAWSYPRGTRQTAAQYRYTIRYRRLGNASWGYVAGAVAAGQAAGTGRVTIGGLDAATWYEVQINAKNELGSSSFSGSIVAQTQTTAIPSAPLNVSLDYIGYSSVQISWAVVQSCNGTMGYEVVFSSNTTSTQDRIERFLPVERTGDRMSFILRGLHSSMQYKMSVRSIVFSDHHDMVVSPLAKPLLFTTSPIPAPMNVTALVPSPPGYPHQLLVSWTTLDDVIGYTLQCSAVGSSPLVYNTLGASPQGGSPTASVLLPVIPNTLYNCSVSATCGSGDCSLKTNVLVRTPEMAPTQPPSDMFVSDITAEGAGLHWSYTTSSARLLGFKICVGCLPLSRGGKYPGCVQSYLPVAGNEGGIFSCSLVDLGSGEECTAVVRPVTSAGDGPNGTLTFSTLRGAPAVIPTSLKATLLSTTPSAQTFNFTWELNMEAGSDDHLGFILRCHDTQDSSPNSMASVSGVTFAQSTTLTVSVATGCNGLMCQIAPFNELGEGVASSAVSLPPSCPSDQSSSSFLSNPNVSLAFLASLIVMAAVLLVLLPLTCVCVLFKKGGKRKRVYAQKIENGDLPTDDNYTTMAPSPCSNSMWRGHTLSTRSQKMGTLSVSTMEMARHPYDTIDKASVQNFYDEIRPKVSNTMCPADQPSQRARVTVVGAKVISGAKCLVPVSQCSAKMTRQNRGSTEYVEMFSIITPNTPEASSPTKEHGPIMLEPISPCVFRETVSCGLGSIAVEDITVATSTLPEAEPYSPPISSCDTSSRSHGRSHDMSSTSHDTAIGSHGLAVGSRDAAAELDYADINGEPQC